MRRWQLDLARCWPRDWATIKLSEGQAALEELPWTFYWRMCGRLVRNLMLLFVVIYVEQEIPLLI